MNEKISGKGVIMVIAMVAIVMMAATATFVLTAGPTKIDDMAIKIAYSNKVDYEPLMVASEKGFFREEGVNVTALIVTGGIQAAEAVATGSADLGAMGDAPGVTLLSQSPEARLVASYGGGEGMHRLIGWTDIQDVADLTGKNVGVQFGSSTQGALLRLMEANGLEPADVTQVPLNPADMPTALKNRQVDAIMGSEPWPTNVERTCGADVAEIANSTGLGSNYPLVLIASHKLVTERPAAVTAALRAIERAIVFMETNYDEALSLCANKTGLSVSDQERCLSTLSYALSLEPRDLDSLNATALFLRANGKIAALPDLARSVNRTYLLAAKG